MCANVLCVNSRFHAWHKTIDSVHIDQRRTAHGASETALAMDKDSLCNLQWLTGPDLRSADPCVLGACRLPIEKHVLPGSTRKFGRCTSLPSVPTCWLCSSSSPVSFRSWPSARHLRIEYKSMTCKSQFASVKFPMPVTRCQPCLARRVRKLLHLD